MPSARKKGTTLAGAYISDEKDEALAKLALKKGYPNKAAFLRALYDEALDKGGTLPRTKEPKKKTQQ
jgi:hypothetical protein